MLRVWSATDHSSTHAKPPSTTVISSTAANPPVRRRATVQCMVKASALVLSAGTLRSFSRYLLIGFIGLIGASCVGSWQRPSVGTRAARFPTASAHRIPRPPRAARVTPRADAGAGPDAVYAAPGVEALSVTLSDDDGGSDSGGGNVIVTPRATPSSTPSRSSSREYGSTSRTARRQAWEVSLLGLSRYVSEATGAPGAGCSSKPRLRPRVPERCPPPGRIASGSRRRRVRHPHRRQSL